MSSCIDFSSSYKNYTEETDNCASHFYQMLMNFDSFNEHAKKYFEEDLPLFDAQSQHLGISSKL